MSTTFLREAAHGTYISVKVQPRSSRNRVAGEQAGELKVYVTAPPVDSAANEAVLELLSEALDCPRSRLQLTKGQTTRHKVIFAAGIPLALAREKLSLEKS
ncbi:MAG: DUF167 domain-containing protein [Verrucomicrobiota bacterium]|jgi:uncharacterized protein (TIGR00251 family)